MNDVMETIGQKRIRVTFNPGQDQIVVDIKQATADLIDRLDDLRNAEAIKQNVSGEKLRLIALAQTSYEEAAMWAVKAVTSK